MEGSAERIENKEYGIDKPEAIRLALFAWCKHRLSDVVSHLQNWYNEGMNMFIFGSIIIISFILVYARITYEVNKDINKLLEELEDIKQDIDAIDRDIDEIRLLLNI